jgi:hypothetical protein
MPIAPNLGVAANVAPNNAVYVEGHASPTITLKTQMVLWIAALVNTLNVENVPNRTVLDWVALMQEVMVALPTVKADQDDIDAAIVGQVVSRSCHATQVAMLDGRITAAQGAAILVAYNDVWFPP